MCFGLQNDNKTDTETDNVCRNDPLVSLNYAVFLYNTGDKAAAARQFHNFEKRLAAVPSGDVDAEVTDGILPSVVHSYHFIIIKEQIKVT